MLRIKANKSDVPVGWVKGCWKTSLMEVDKDNLHQEDMDNLHQEDMPSMEEWQKDKGNFRTTADYLCTHSLKEDCNTCSSSGHSYLEPSHCHSRYLESGK